eukprot:6131568-Amphidinium_carterae.1
MITRDVEKVYHWLLPNAGPTVVSLQTAVEHMSGCALKSVEVRLVLDGRFATHGLMMQVEVTRDSQDGDLENALTADSAHAHECLAQKVSLDVSNLSYHQLQCVVDCCPTAIAS